MKKYLTKSCKKKVPESGSGVQKALVIHTMFSHVQVSCTMQINKIIQTRRTTGMLTGTDNTVKL